MKVKALANTYDITKGVVYDVYFDADNAVVILADDSGASSYVAHNVPELFKLLNGSISLPEIPCAGTKVVFVGSKTREGLTDITLGKTYVIAGDVGNYHEDWYIIDDKGERNFSPSCDGAGVYRLVTEKESNENVELRNELAELRETIAKLTKIADALESTLEN